MPCAGCCFGVYLMSAANNPPLEYVARLSGFSGFRWHLFVTAQQRGPKACHCFSLQCSPWRLVRLLCGPFLLPCSVSIALQHTAQDQTSAATFCPAIAPHPGLPNLPPSCAASIGSAVMSELQL